MIDLISRLSELRCQYNCFDENERDAYHTLSEAIEALSDVPDTNVGDTISRQAAVDVLEERLQANGYSNAALVSELNRSIGYLMQLPSAQQEIIRCKDCKYWIPYDWMFSEVWKSQNIDDYAESEIGCTYCDMSMDAMDYCSRGERKDG